MNICTKVTYSCLFSDPEVDEPVEAVAFIDECLQHNVAVGLVKLPNQGCNRGFNLLTCGLESDCFLAL